MRWYDRFASFYDTALERSYREQRALACEALMLRPGLRVLDAPCGTGASFSGLVAGVGSDGSVIGVDLSAGMLRRAAAHVEAHGWSRLELVQSDFAELASARTRAGESIAPVDRLHVFLGMSVAPDMARAFDALWSQLAPGGRCVLVDVHAQRLSLQGWSVNLIARADIRRRFWEPLQRVATDFELRDLPYRREHGGQIMLAAGNKPR